MSSYTKLFLCALSGHVDALISITTANRDVMWRVCVTWERSYSSRIFCYNKETKTTTNKVFDTRKPHTLAIHPLARSSAIQWFKPQQVVPD